eukprot:gnl/TRDRNA2_/TRDRNA2_155873_c1_seq4.p1 gnl/TRDRNA2_/TRDRNA2_155873_c1~~gnl/TRDRNA2_/TRDRNA2_155873_c1_seq4.p1  ORF type:complete len:400 (+),score=89.79 gnl/TRDRNA2_/TRDRNA2_155873_c1_seq4:151-1200(+)
MHAPLEPDAILSPKAFMHNISAIAKANKQHLVLPEGEDVRIVEAAGRLLADDICKLTIIGKPAEVAAHAKAAGVSVAGATIIDHTTANIDDMVKALVDARKAQGMTPEKATETLRGDQAYFGTMMMYMGKVDGMVSGAARSTADTMRPALQVIKQKKGVSQVSSVFFMLLPDGCKVFSDAGIVIDPDAKQLAEIAVETAKTARAFGIAPRIAMLSYVTGDSDTGPLTDRVRQATKIAKEIAPSELIEGPIQYDAAVDPRVANVKFKGKPGAVAGKASVCIFPDINAGNITYKATQQAAKCIAIGPIMQGMNKPVNDLSRGCTVDDAVYAAIVTCLQAIDGKTASPSSKL